MRTWLITFLVSTVVSVVLWQFGLAYTIWPAHAFLATIGIAIACGIAAHIAIGSSTRFKT